MSASLATQPPRARESTFIEIRQAAWNFGNFDRPSRDAIAGLINDCIHARAHARTDTRFSTYAAAAFGTVDIRLSLCLSCTSGGDGRYFIHNSRYDSHNAPLPSLMHHPARRVTCSSFPSGFLVARARAIVVRAPANARSSSSSSSRDTATRVGRPKWIYVTENPPISAPIFSLPRQTFSRGRRYI